MRKFRTKCPKGEAGFVRRWPELGACENRADSRVPGNQRRRNNETRQAQEALTGCGRGRVFMIKRSRTFMCISGTQNTGVSKDRLHVGKKRFVEYRTIYDLLR